MRVLYLNSMAQLGGAEVVLLNLIATLRETEPGWHLELIAGEHGPLIGKAHALGVRTRVVALPEVLARLGDSGVNPLGLRRLGWALLAFPAALLYVQRLRRAIRSIAPSVIHTTGFKMHILGLWSSGTGTPVLWHIDDYVSSRKVMARLLGRYAGRCSGAVAVSTSVADDLAAVCRGRTKIHTVENATDTEEFSPRGPIADLDRLSGLPSAAPGTVRVGLLASFARWKGHEVFLRALSLLPPGLPVRGYIVGAALYKTIGSEYSIKELEGMVRNFGISGQVGFTGFIEDPAAALRALDIVVHASTLPEPFGMAIIEAMSCGRAVIISRGGGASANGSPGHDALDHTPGDAQELADRICLLARSQELRARLGKAARLNAASRFDRRRLAAAIAPIYRQAAGTESRAADSQEARI